MAATQPALSRSWRVDRRLEGFYTGGRLEVAPRGAAPPGEAPFVACMNGEAVSCVAVGDGCRVLHELEVEEDGFTSFSLLPGRREAVTVGKSFLLRHWDLETGRQRRAWKGHQMPVLDMAADPSGTLVATASSDRSVRVWNVDGGFCTHSFRGHGSIVQRVVFHPDVSRLLLVSCAEDGDVRVWELKTNKCHRLQNHMSAVRGVAFSADGNTLVTGGHDRVLNVWSLETFELVCTVPVYEHIESVVACPRPVRFPGATPEYLARHGADPHFVVAGDKGLVRFFNAATHEVVHTHKLPYATVEEERRAASADGNADAASADGGVLQGAGSMARQVTNLAWLPRGKDDGAVGKADDGKDAGDAGKENGGGGGAAAAGKGKGKAAKGKKRGRAEAAAAKEEAAPLLMVTTAEHNFHLYRHETMEQERFAVGFNDEIVDVRCLPDNRRVAVATNSENVRVFDSVNFDSDVVVGHTDVVLSLDVSPCGRWLVTGSKDNTVRLWSLERPAPPAASGEAEDEDEAARPAKRRDAAAHDAAAAAAAAAARKASRFKYLACVSVLAGHADAVSAVAFSRMAHKFHSPAHSIKQTDRRPFVVSAGRDRTMKLWDVAPACLAAGEASGEDRVELHSRLNVLAHEKDVNAVAVSPNDLLVATGSQDRTIKVWNAQDLSVLGTLQGHRRGVWCVEFSPVDKVLASASGDRTIRVWSLTDHSCLRTFEGHLNSVLKVKFLRAGMQLMSSASDGVMKLWTIKTSECVNTFDEAHAEKVWSFDTFDGGRKMVSGGVDSVLNVWRDSTEEEKDEELAEEQGRVLKEQELANSLRQRDFVRAVALALELEQPRRLLATFVDIAAAEDAERAGGEAAHDTTVSMADVIRGLTPEQVAVCVRYAREWNTNTRNCYAAHRFMRSLFSTLPPAHLLECLKDTPGREDVLSSLALYSERHYKRVERMMTQTYLLDYLLESMQGAAPEAASDDESDDAAEADEAWGVQPAMWHEDRSGAGGDAVAASVDATKALEAAAAAGGAEAEAAYAAAAGMMQGNWSGSDDDGDEQEADAAMTPAEEEAEAVSTPAGKKDKKKKRDKKEKRSAAKAAAKAAVAVVDSDSEEEVAPAVVLGEEGGEEAEEAEEEAAPSPLPTPPARRTRSRAKTPAKEERPPSSKKKAKKAKKAKKSSKSRE